MNSVPESMRAALSAALRRFPSLELTIRQLIATDQNFRDMCDELAEAEAALSRVDQLPLHICAIRKAEWGDLVERLAREILAALQEKQTIARSHIIPPSPR
ncbi:hypothetical protein [Aminobacter sp. AP02]|uniref:hypothetical protein n=1 Tax=Aminobacter sp. AP02 TaxID=2135737 RepID=UPI000D6B7C56|nr:hypothetical protein [Aminobacter sp. AP02]PWK66442.1 hypothetical protein C8K44_11475 [Aminobacter sp. AP02]